MFKYHNPSNIVFDTGIIDNKEKLKNLLGKGLDINKLDYHKKIRIRFI